MSESTEGSVLKSLAEKLAILEAKYSELEKRHVALAQANGVPKAPSEGVEAKNGPVLEAPGEKIGLPKKNNKSRVKVLISKIDPSQNERVEVPEESQSEETPSERNEDECAFVLKKILYGSNLTQEEDESTIDIKNRRLWDLLKSHLGWYPDHLFRGPPVTLNSPYEALVYSWDVLKEAARAKSSNEDDKQAREDLELLLGVISGGSSGDIRLDGYFKVRGAYLSNSTIAFQDLWTLFPPGMLVYGKPFQDQDQVFITQSHMGNIWPEGDRTQQVYPWEMRCWMYDWTGERFKRTPMKIPIEYFEGHMPVTALPYFPFHLHRDKDKITENLLKRGREFRALCKAKEGARMFDYKGLAIFDKKGFSGIQTDDDESEARPRSIFSSELEFFARLNSRRRAKSNDLKAAKSSHVDSRVMVDFESYFQYGPATANNGQLEKMTVDTDCMCLDCQNNPELSKKYRMQFDQLQSQYGDEAWDDEQLMLCPPRVLGYILRAKQWAQLEVDRIAMLPPSDNSGPWSRLKLVDEEHTKDLLLNLVKSHVSSSLGVNSGKTGLEVDDITPGKGKGLVILLYGPPGVGKTSTAETIAAASAKPLFSISVADVGTKARHVEANLAKIFSLATSWQAILLIDEADVFLESRGKLTSISTEKNALVSVFLRVLEYYQGIVFLTTNQIKQLDIAIPSRIHIAIKYNPLTDDQMDAIFRGFLEPLNKEGKIEDFRSLMRWLKEDVYYEKFDGRQIRNIVTTALGLARADHAEGKTNKLTKSHMLRAFRNCKSFKDEWLLEYNSYMQDQKMRPS